MLPPLDNERKQKICEMYKSGATLKEIQEATGCHASMVEKVVKGAGLEQRRPRRKREKPEEPTKKTNSPACICKLALYKANLFLYCLITSFKIII